MATGSLLDHSVGMAIETTYATGVTAARFAEWTPGNALDHNPMPTQGAGIRQGSRFPRSGRRVPIIGQGSGNITMDVLSKGMGLWWQLGFGTSVSNLVSGSTYQQNHTTVLPGNTTLKSGTVQEGIVEAQGNIDVYTWTGVTVATLTLACSNSAPILNAAFDVDAKALATGIAYATPAYTSLAGARVFNFANMVATLGGTLTEPTTSALASAASPTTLNVRGVTFALDNGIDNARWVPGSRNQPTSGARVGTLTLQVEYDAVTGTMLRDAYLNQTDVGPFVWTFTGGALSSGNETLQLVLPSLMIDSGAIPQPSDDNTIVTSIQLSTLDNLTNTQPLWLLTRTADAAL